MDVKAFLREIRSEREEIQLLRSKIIQSKDRAMPSGMGYSSDKVQTSPKDIMTDALIDAADYQEKLDRLCEKLERRQQKAIDMIESLEKSDQRKVMEIRYLHTSNPTWEEVADTLYMSRQNVLVLHGAALVWLNERYGKEEA